MRITLTFTSLEIRSYTSTQIQAAAIRVLEKDMLLIAPQLKKAFLPRQLFGSNFQLEGARI